MDSRWSENVSVEAFDDDQSTLVKQIRETKSSAKMQFYREVHFPLSVHDLVKDLKGNLLIWLDAESFIVLKNLPKSVPSDSTFRTASIGIDFEQKAVHIYGKTNEVVARAAGRLLCLKDERAEEVRVGVRDYRRGKPWVSTAFITPQFLKAYREANPNRLLFLSRWCFLSVGESVALASHPDPLYVGLECRHETQPFRTAFAQRTSEFGILSFHTSTFDCYFSFSGEGSRALSKVSIETNSGCFHISQCLKALTEYPARKIEYTILDRGFDQGFFDDIEPFTIAPKAATLVFAGFLPSRLHKLFLQASGTLSELGLIYHVSHTPSMAQQNELLKAIESNQNLNRLELGCLSILDTFWEELLETIGSHGGLRTVVFRVRNEPDPDMVESLVAFIKAHIHLDISIKCRGWLSGSAYEMEAAVDVVRHQNRAAVLARKPAHDRPSLLGAALTKWAGGHFSNTSLLLSENTDLLCSLMGQDPTSPPLTANLRRARSDDGMANERRVKCRKTDRLSSPE